MAVNKTTFISRLLLPLLNMGGEGGWLFWIHVPHVSFHFLFGRWPRQLVREGGAEAGKQPLLSLSRQTPGRLQRSPAAAVPYASATLSDWTLLYTGGRWGRLRSAGSLEILVHLILQRHIIFSLISEIKKSVYLTSVIIHTWERPVLPFLPLYITICKHTNSCYDAFDSYTVWWSGKLQEVK